MNELSASAHAEVNARPEGVYALAREASRRWAAAPTVDRRPSWCRPLANLATWVRDRAEYDQRDMEHTLLRLKAAAEAARG